MFSSYFPQGINSGQYTKDSKYALDVIVSQRERDSEVPLPKEEWIFSRYDIDRSTKGSGHTQNMYLKFYNLSKSKSILQQNRPQS